MARGFRHWKQYPHYINKSHNYRNVRRIAMSKGTRMVIIIALILIVAAQFVLFPRLASMNKIEDMYLIIAALLNLAVFIGIYLLFRSSGPQELETTLANGNVLPATITKFFQTGTPEKIRGVDFYDMQVEVSIRKEDGSIVSGTFLRRLPEGALFLNLYTVGKEIKVIYDPAAPSDIRIDTTAAGQELM